MVGLIVGFTINEFLRIQPNDILFSNHNEDSKDDHDKHHTPSESQTVISTTPITRIHQLQEEFDLLTNNPSIKFEKYKEILQEKENLLNERILEYKKLKSESLNREEEIKLEIKCLDDFIEKLKLFIQQEEEKEAILVNDGKENILTMMNVLLYDD